MKYREKLAAWLETHSPSMVEPSHFHEIIAALAPISEPTLRRLLRESGQPLSPLVEGVRQDKEANLQRTLAALAEIYKTKPTEARSLVLLARRHAEWNLRRRPDDAHRQEVLLWLRTWLENPGVFATWARLRRAAKSAADGQ